MRILEMVEEIEQQAEAAGGYAVITPPGWEAATTPDADLHWRAAPNPVDGSLTQDPDFSYPTTAGPLAFRLFYYGGNAALDGEYGMGRRASWPLRLTNDGTTVTVMHDDGVDRQYRNDGTNHFAVIGLPSGDTLTYDAVNGWDETRGDTGYKFHFPAGNSVSLAYRAMPQGLFITCNYDTSHRLSSLVEPAGRRLTFSYNGDGHVQVIQDWGYRQDTLLTYVGSDLTEVWEPNGAVTQYRYDSSHRMTAIYDPLGYGTTYTYDSSSRVLTRSVAGNLGRYNYVAAGPALQTGYTDPNGNTWTHLSNAGIPTGQIDPLGNVQTFVYQSCRPAAITNALGYTTSYSYEVYGFPAGRQDALGNRWTYTRDPGAHVLLTAQGPLGFVTTYLWGATPALRQLQAVVDPLGNTTTFGYLASGLPQYRQDPLGNLTTYAWTNQALLSAATNALGYTTTYLYDLGTNRVGVIDPLGNQWTQGFDSMRRRVSVQNPLGQVATVLYDARGKVQAEIDPLGDQTTHLWNGYGSQTERIDSLGYHWTTVFDAKGRSVASVDPLGRRSTLVYDAADRRVAAVDTAGLWHTTVYDAASQPVSSIEPSGVQNTAIFDAAGRAVAALDPLGLRGTVVYDAAGRRSATVQPTGARATVVYDSASRAVASVDALGFMATTVYDSASRPVARVDALGNRSSAVYDATGAKIARISPDGAVATAVYDLAGRPVASVDPLGYRSTTVFDPAGHAVAAVNALGYTSTAVYDAGGHQVATVDSLGYRATVSYDPASRPTGRLDALGQRATTVYDASGATVASVNALGYVTTAVYDLAGRRTGAIDPLGNVTTRIFDSFGRLVADVDARGYVATTIFDSFGRPAAGQDALGYRTTTVFDSFSRASGAVDPLGYRTTASFDLLNRTVAQADALGSVTTAVFDPVGRGVASVDALGRISTAVYDSRGRTIAAVNPLGYRTSFSFDLRGGQIGTTNARGYQSTTIFDALARAQATVDALGRRTTLGYDARNAVVQRTDGSGQVETRTYDALGRYSASQYADAARATMSYDPLNRVVQMANQAGVWTRTYDPAGRRVTENATGHPNGWPLTSVYDANANRVALVTWRGTQTWAYDARNQIRVLADIEGGLATWAYDGRQMISQQQNPNGTATAVTYDGNGRSLSILHTHPVGTWLDSAIYTYDQVGNPLTLNRQDGDPSSYQYDNANQILVQSAPTEGTKTWTYDPAGNRVSEQSNPGQSTPAISYWTTCTFDAADQQLNEVVTGSVIGSSSTATFQYDGNGNRILETKLKNFVTTLATYLWDPSNRLAVIQDGSYVVTNSYRPDGMRHQRVDQFGTEQMVWDRNDTLAWVDGSGSLGRFFTRGARAVKTWAPARELFYHVDAIGTMQAYSNPNGTTNIRALLDAWGGDPGSMGIDECSFVGDLGYRSELGMLHRPLYYVRARWLVAGGPGWLSADPVRTAASLYNYVRNRPSVQVDPSGMNGDNAAPMMMPCQGRVNPVLCPPPPPAKVIQDVVPPSPDQPMAGGSMGCMVTLLPKGACPNCDWQQFLCSGVGMGSCAEVDCVKNMHKCDPKMQWGFMLDRLAFIAQVLAKLAQPPPPMPGTSPMPQPQPQPNVLTQVGGLPAAATLCCNDAQGNCAAGTRCFDCGTGAGYSDAAGCVQECLLLHEGIHVKQCTQGFAFALDPEQPAWYAECTCIVGKLNALADEVLGRNQGENLAIPCCSNPNVVSCNNEIGIERRRLGAALPGS